MGGLVAVMGEVGRQLGVREELNLCNGGLAEAREYARLLHQQIKQHLLHPTQLAEGWQSSCCGEQTFSTPSSGPKRSEHGRMACSRLKLSMRKNLRGQTCSFVNCRVLFCVRASVSLFSLSSFGFLQTI